ncbi:hypothetical protein [Rufibacter hautae]|uniref:Uncharacterized protein n=1 Tax=Rufibacter hautae TaxID=2595005 RepID=A0A5B6TM86_9BACT|nr:hypothetical protein [Rufibacter hautae]KAA3440600.1 hypothetical protein FOA19_08095 [Rufibacter hautae]
MEPITNLSPAGAARQKKLFLPIGFALLLLAILMGVMYLFRNATLQPTATNQPANVAPLPALPDITVPGETNLPDTDTSRQVIGTTADLASHPMFAPLQQQLPDSMPLIFRPEKWEGRPQ